MEEFREFFNELGDYLHDIAFSVKPTLVAIFSIVTYILFPDKAYVPAAIALGGAVCLDILTKYYAISVKNKGLRNAIKTRAISSDSLWIGTKRKLISYLVIMVLCGLSVRVTMLTSVAVFLSTIAYSIMFLRESQSVIENLIDAGHTDLSWLLSWLKKKEEKVLEDENIKNPIEETIKSTNNYDDKI